MKKIWKSTIAAAIICAMALALAGCRGGNSGNSGSGSDSGSKTASAGEVIDNGAFSATCPSGFRNIVQTDVFGEKDADGNYPVSQKLLMFSYGAKNDYDAFSKPSVNIYLLDEGNTADGTISSFSYFYDEVEETTFNVNGEEIKGVKVKSEMSDGDVYNYDIGFIEKDGRLFQISVVTAATDYEDGTGLSMECDEVQAICDSIAVTAEAE